MKRPAPKKRLCSRGCTAASSSAAHAAPSLFVGDVKFYRGRVRSKSDRLGMTMLELVIATSLLTMVLATVGVVLRTGRQAWEAHSADYSRVEAAHATVRHIVRQVRQAESVAEITPANDNSGRLSLALQGGSTVVWDHDGATNAVNFGVTNPTGILATDIQGLRFTGYRADGVTVTNTASLVRAIRIDATIQLPVEVNASRVVSSWAWIRSW